MIQFSLLLFSIIPVAVLGYLTKKSYRSHLRVRTAILGATFVHESVLVVFPIWYSVFTGYSLESEMIIPVNSLSLLVVVIGEAIFVMLFAVGMQIGQHKVFEVRRATTVPDDREHLFLSFLVLAGLFIYMIQFTAPPTTFDTAIAHSEGRYFNNIVGMFFAWFRGFFQFACLVACTLVLLNSRREKRCSGMLRLMAVATLALVAVLGLSAGIRGRILWVVSLLIIIGYIKGRKEPFLIGPFLVVLIIPFFMFLGGPYRSIYFIQAEQGVTRWELLGSLVQEAGNHIVGGSKYGSSNESFLESFAERTQASRNSVVLYQLYRDGSDAGLKPLVAAIVTPIPRIIWPGKRPAGSIDETTYGSAIYLVRRLGYGAPWYNMGPYLASMHAYWEGGWIWLVFSGFVTGLIWNLILRWCDKSRRAISIVVALIFSFGVLANGLPTALQPLYDFVRLFWATVLPTIVLRKITGLISIMKIGLFAPHVQRKKRNELAFNGIPLQL